MVIVFHLFTFYTSQKALKGKKNCRIIMVHVINIYWIIPHASHYISYLNSPNGKKTVSLPKNSQPPGRRQKQTNH